MDSRVFIFIVFASNTFSLKYVANPTVNIGCLFPNNAKKHIIQKVCDLAREDFRNISEQHGLDLNFQLEEGGCDVVTASGKAGVLIHQFKASVLIGPNCNDACISVANFVYYANIPMISYSCSGYYFSDTPFIRTIPNVMANARELVHQYFDFINSVGKWKYVCVISSEEKPWSKLESLFIDKLGESNITINNQFQVEHVTEKKMKAKLLKNTEVILFICDSGMVNKFMKILSENGSNYAYLTINYEYNEARLKQLYTDLNITRRFGFINVGLKAQYPKSDRFTRAIRDAMNHGNVWNEEYVKEAAYMYDAVKAYLLALNNTIYAHFETLFARSVKKSNINEFFRLNNLSVGELMYGDNVISSNHTWIYPSDWHLVNDSIKINLTSVRQEFNVSSVIKDGKEIRSQLLKLKFSGMSGEIQFNSNGDRFNILAFDNVIIKADGKVWTPTIFEYDNMKKEERWKLYLKNIVWGDGSTNIPRYYSKECSKNCDESSVQLLLVYIFSPIGAVVILAVAIRIYKKKKYENDLTDKSIIFKFSELTIPEPKAVDESCETPSSSAESLSVAGDVSRVDFLTTPRKLPKGRRNCRTESINLLNGVGTLNDVTGVRTFIGKYGMEDMFVKQIPKQQVIVSREILVEIKEIRDLKHPNLNPYEGVCVGPPYVFIVSPVSSKGTLIDALQNEDIQLNWLFRYTFATDIANGLAALHESPVKYHGHLTSRNVIIDSRWSCKITDYGLFQFKETPSTKASENFNDDKKYEALLWTAPENINFPRHKKSKEGDIYSYGIILSEIINRAQAFSSFDNYTYRDIIHFIQRRCIPPFRPHVRLQSGLDGRLLEMMRCCWDEFPANRPTICAVKTKLKTIHNVKINSTTLLDTMIDMMEKYAHDLSSALNERTKQLQVEKEKAERAIVSSLPPDIAEHARAGLAIEPQKSSKATVMVFKVNGVNELTKTLLPTQIVEVLDDVYRLLNTAIKGNTASQFLYDRDRHYVGCGLMAPSKLHAYRMAKIALKVLGSQLSFGFRHIKRNQIRFQIILHSGEFFTAIQQGRSKSFIVFGNSMNYAELLLESTPQQRIFATNECHQCIPREKAVKFEPSGHILLRGHGPITGHFLVGMKGMNVKLPETNVSKDTVIAKLRK